MYRPGNLNPTKGTSGKAKGEPRPKARQAGGCPGADLAVCTRDQANNYEQEDIDSQHTLAANGHARPQHQPRTEVQRTVAASAAANCITKQERM
eukprot:CAMPEP_0170203912 /NCGR_PEP_ID=MMETSP0116_2-20130129/1471_1 /TAXON_ID=400756 /ORGANISM="Durinskia baltica, Strain CSIRO CS-38" /LENGTH=93 /DNA_ID=CAMNT_0010454245 /DNA_START=113 /DNA_END=395 /DNA_ORIENTATION=-